MGLGSSRGQYQYGCGKSHGCSLLAGHVTKLSEDKPTWCHAHIDIKHAFTAIHRSVLPRVLRKVSADLESSQYHWTGISPVAWLTKGGGHRRDPLTLRQGIPQGDPMSSYTFALCLDEAVQSMVQAAAAYD